MMKPKAKSERKKRAGRVQLLAGGLAKISRHLVECGLGPVNLGKLARQMLKLRANDKLCREAGQKDVNEH